ncbi:MULTISPECIES: tetratricopeptide repeat protein [Bacillus]|uniref:Tetratricopeptide repeat-containing protein n=2 Tax=Bacillus cereus group TaxID=86661 RepID=A0A2C1DI07_BACCE|nr:MULTISPECIES: tetratricopeptide repeat protein [Bacillus cereus group]OFD83572.1 tetratricopeptide domain protein [Bacillus mycoides]OFD83644.1 tetratricopeptide domain protein [Bacillus mycoides]OFD85860.1 tetratricopeptide domain protein [Bacillus mycoides]PGS99329.1 tetratricopeptide repeat-containing protein [Bacillus cereus]
MIAANAQEKIIQLLNEWYLEIRSRRIKEAERLKEKIDVEIHKLKREAEENFQNQNLSLYYSLLKFRYNYLIDNLGLNKDSFNEIDSFEKPTDNFLAYYYNFFKGMHANELGNYHLAKEHYDRAEVFLKYAPDSLEQAEFYYKSATFYYDIQEGLKSINYAKKAKEMFAEQPGYEINIAFCENILGLACIYLREWELAEEHFMAALDQFQKNGEEKFILMVRHNLGWMYSSQNMSTLAIRYLSEVVEKNPNHYKAIFAKALEHYKLEEVEIAGELIEKGLSISNEINQLEFQHRFKVLKEQNDNSSAQKLEIVVLEGVQYFEREELYEYMQEHYETLGIKFFEEEKHTEASKYFYLSAQARKKAIDKGALK